MSVTIETSDNVQFLVPRDVLMCSGLFSEMLEDSNEDESIPVPLVDSKIMNHIIRFMKNQAIDPMGEIEKPIKSPNMDELVGEWYSKFINDIEMDMVFKLIEAANYLQIDSLLHLGCVKVATTLKGKRPEEIREIFGIE